MRRLLLPLAAALLAAALSRAEHDGGRGVYEIGLWGDLPYDSTASNTQTTVGVHDGDIKSGSTRCDDDAYARFEGFLDALRAPAVHTPGDRVDGLRSARERRVRLRGAPGVHPRDALRHLLLKRAPPVPPRDAGA